MTKNVINISHSQIFVILLATDMHLPCLFEVDPRSHFQSMPKAVLFYYSTRDFPVKLAAKYEYIDT